MKEFKHEPVMLEEVIDALNVKEDGVYVDGTVGGAGHAYELCLRLSPKGRFIGMDRDKDALCAARERLSGFGQATVVRDNYSNFLQVLRELDIQKVDGILLDLGVSSYQLDTKERGFSYLEDAPLDMRMDDRQQVTAKEIVNGYEESELYRVIRDYGEERYAKNIAKRIVAFRAGKEIETTKELSDLVTAAIPAKNRMKYGHPAKRTFQAIRIECNGELEALESSLHGMVESLRTGGRICVITFHSLEDRIVKNAFRTCENPCTCPSSFPVCVCGKEPLGAVLTKKPIRPKEKEISRNKRAKSAKLRVLERI